MKKRNEKLLILFFNICTFLFFFTFASVNNDILMASAWGLVGVGIMNALFYFGDKLRSRCMKIDNDEI